VSATRRILLVQLPIPQPGIEPARGNVPLAAGYLKLFATQRGLGRYYDIEILPPALANRLADQALVEAILVHEPWMVGFTCYLWNVERSLWVAEQLKRRRPELRVVVGGPEITPDNDWVLGCPQVDFAAIGEGEQTFSELLEALLHRPLPERSIPGLYVSPHAVATASCRPQSPVPSYGSTDLPLGPPPASTGLLPPPNPEPAAAPRGPLPAPRAPLARLDIISSPYLAGIIDAAEEGMLLLETIRGCVYRCKFCYYPKSYDNLYFLSPSRIIDNLRYARERGVREVILLDPTLNQRRDFRNFLRLLATCNPEQSFTYFGELRAEGIDTEIASLLREANFNEVEIGLQSIEPAAQTLMDRRNNRRAYERGVAALLDAGMHVKVDLIVGLPGDTPESVRRSIRYVHDSGLYSDVQVFNLSILPGTSFREEASRHGLVFQSRPPYSVLQTPTMDLEEICALMAEAEETFNVEFDALPPPHLDRGPLPGDPPGVARSWFVDFDRDEHETLYPATRRANGFTLWLRGDDLGQRTEECAQLVRRVLEHNFHTSLQVVLEPTGDPRRVTPELLETLLEACYRVPTYLDRYYSLAPGGVKGTKRIVVLVPGSQRAHVGAAWIGAVGECATVAWQGAMEDVDLDAHEILLVD
jgi:radical SAM superfamily enzyme YgiQ (UPF0313 family)